MYEFDRGERNELYADERAEQRWQQWKPHQPNIFPLPGRDEQETDR